MPILLLLQLLHSIFDIGLLCAHGIDPSMQPKHSKMGIMVKEAADKASNIVASVRAQPMQAH